MKSLNDIRRSLVNLAVLLGTMAVMSIVVGLANQSVIHSVDTLSWNNRQLEMIAR